MNKRIRAAFDRAHATYADAALVQREAAADCVAALPAGRWPSVLEIGAGGGVLTRLAARRLSWERYVALDPAPRMLRLAAGAAERVFPVLADGETAPFREGSFDALLSSSAMQWYRRPEVSIPANLRLLRPGGAFSLSLFVAGSLRELAEAGAVAGFGAVRSLLPAELYADLLASLPGVTFEHATREIVQWFDSVPAFLDVHRRTGATASDGVGGRPSPSAYRRLQAAYAERFGRDGRIPATSVVLRLTGTRG